MTETIYVCMICDEYGGVSLDRAFTEIEDAKTWASNWAGSGKFECQIRTTELED